MTKYLIVGGVAAGMAAVARLRRLDQTVDMILFERGGRLSCPDCGQDAGCQLPAALFPGDYSGRRL
jgi:flavin-dependent dehydrogenase